MGRSHKRKRHFMEELISDIRKPALPPNKVHRDRSEKRNKRFDWRDEMQGD